MIGVVKTLAAARASGVKLKHDDESVRTIFQLLQKGHSRVDVCRLMLCDKDSLEILCRGPQPFDEAEDIKAIERWFQDEQKTKSPLEEWS